MLHDLPRPLTLSVVMAIYNEAATVAPTIDQVLGVDLPDVEVELILVESNSSDGTREIVQPYAEDPRVVLVLQDEPAGQGERGPRGFSSCLGRDHPHPGRRR